MKYILGKDDVIEGSYMKDYTNQYVVIKESGLSKEYRDAKYQLFYAKSGFGCDPSKMGTAVFGYFCGDGEDARMERYSMLGIIKPESLEEWKKVYGSIVTPEDYE